MADLVPKIETNAAAPRRVESDGTVAEQHSLKDQIAADQYSKASQAMKNRSLPFRRIKMRAPNPGDVNIRDCQ